MDINFWSWVKCLNASIVADCLFCHTELNSDLGNPFSECNSSNLAVVFNPSYLLRCSSLAITYLGSILTRAEFNAS